MKRFIKIILLIASLFCITEANAQVRKNHRLKKAAAKTKSTVKKATPASEKPEPKEIFTRVKISTEFGDIW